MSEIVSLLIEYKGITIARIYNIAATRIQAYYRGYRIRTSFNERKKLIMKHMQLRAKKKRDRKEKRHKRKTVEKSPIDDGNAQEKRQDESKSLKNSKEDENIRQDKNAVPSPRSRIHKVAGKFLGSVVEEHQRSSYFRRVQPGQDEPLPETKRKMSRSKSVNMALGSTDPVSSVYKRTSSASLATDKDLNMLPLSSFLEGKSSTGNSRTESRFSYNLKN